MAHFDPRMDPTGLFRLVFMKVWRFTPSRFYLPFTVLSKAAFKHFSAGKLLQVSWVFQLGSMIYEKICIPLGVL